MATSPASRVSLRRRIRTYRCKYCGERFERSKPRCPQCKTRKGHARLGPPAGRVFPFS